MKIIIINQLIHTKYSYCIWYIIHNNTKLYTAITKATSPRALLNEPTHKQDYVCIYKVNGIACTASLTWVNKAQAVSLQLHSKNNYSVV